MKRYYYLLDGARFFAAFWVMNFHYLFGNGPDTQLHWYRYGNLGVQVFFIISGFVIVQSLRGKSLKEFAVGRFVRLFPLFWVLCTLTYLLTVFFPDVRYILNITDYMRSMTMLGDVFDGIIGPATLVDPSYWTLTVELIFYIAIALYTSLFTHGKIRYFLLAWLILSACAFALHIDENFYVKLLLVRHAAYFIFGAALALLVGHEAHTKRERALDWALLFMSAGYATYIHERALPSYTAANLADPSIITLLHVAFFLAVPALVFLSRYVRHPRLIQCLAIAGGLTYPLYLLHQRIGNMLIDMTTGNTTVSWFTIVLWFQVFMICLAYVSYVLDKKLRAWLLERPV